MNLDDLIPSTNNFEIYEVKPSEVPKLKQALANARREVGQKDEVFSSTRGLTVVMWPLIPERRRVQKLMECAEKIGQILGKTNCTIHDKNEVASYVNGGYIDSFEQSHLGEHLVMPYLKYAQNRDLEIDAESADLADLGPGKIVTVFTGKYDHAVLKDILSFTWHWMGQAITKAEFPDSDHFEKMLRIRIETINNKEVTMEDMKKILAAD